MTNYFRHVSRLMLSRRTNPTHTAPHAAHGAPVAISAQSGSGGRRGRDRLSGGPGDKKPQGELFTGVA